MSFWGGWGGGSYFFFLLLHKSRVIVSFGASQLHNLYLFFVFTLNFHCFNNIKRCALHFSDRKIITLLISKKTVLFVLIRGIKTVHILKSTGHCFH